MPLLLGDEFPNFKGKTTIGEIDFHEYIKDS
jgi:thioredoxin-dependent peroxiredoxin